MVFECAFFLYIPPREMLGVFFNKPYLKSQQYRIIHCPTIHSSGQHAGKFLPLPVVMKFLYNYVIKYVVAHCLNHDFKI
jgi:hypothetical protein